MSLLKTNSVQIGQSATATQNFTLTVPATPNGTVKLSRGNAGATTQDVLTIASDGTVGVIDINSTSDIQLKENIVALKGLDMIRKLDAFEFTWKHSGKKSYGLIAQYVEENFPELVSENENGYKSVHYIPLIAVLIDSVKQLESRIEQLENNK
jgi:hypothetical protein